MLVYHRKLTLLYFKAICWCAYTREYRQFNYSLTLIFFIIYLNALSTTTE